MPALDSRSTCLNVKVTQMAALPQVIHCPHADYVVIPEGKWVSSLSDFSANHP